MLPMYFIFVYYLCSIFYIYYLSTLYTVYFIPCILYVHKENNTGHEARKLNCEQVVDVINCSWRKSRFPQNKETE